MKEDSVHISSEVASHQFSFGNIYSNLLYASAQDLKILGINGLVYQLICQNINRPSFNSYKDSKAWDDISQPKGYVGFEGAVVSMPPYFYRIFPDWLQYKAEYYKQHHEEIPWDDSYKDYLPNPLYLLCKMEDKIKEIGLDEKYKVECESQGVHKLTVETLPYRLKKSG